MSLNNLRPPKGAKQSPTRVGRGKGSGLGKTAGRGHKGAQSRSGYHSKRGFHNPFRTEYVVINLDTLGAAFEAGATVTPDVLRERGLVSSSHKKPVKVLGRGEIAIALNVQADKFSGKAAEKIQAAGGKAETLGAAR